MGSGDAVGGIALSQNRQSFCAGLSLNTRSAREHTMIVAPIAHFIEGTP
jgi:hypothetical protein